MPPRYRQTDSPWLRPELVTWWPEIVVVLLVVVGPFAGKSIWMAMNGSSAAYLTLLLNNSRLLNGTAMESGLLAAFLGFLYWRGWRPTDFKIKPGWLSSLEGVVLFPTVFVGNLMVVSVLLALKYLLQSNYQTPAAFLLANSPHLEPHSIQVSWAVLIGTMILNGFYEEMTCMGYAFNQFAAKGGPIFALILTVCLRMACHAYQGPVHMFGIGMVFLIFGVVYIFTRNLWPLIFGHILLDVASTSLLKVHFG